MAKTVFVGLSGGVDSAVSAALLKERGVTVVGAFIKIWSPEFIECTWKEDRLDAMRVCAALQIPFREVDLSEQYKREVVEDMISNYQKGLTPNPDVLCNRSIKFGHFATWAFENGADAIATGHYARIEEDSGRFALLRGADGNKDQSYFLHMLDQQDLARVMFPVGDHTKPQIRELARKFDLPNAQRPDSQGLCFVGDVSMKEFLGRFIKLEKGTLWTSRTTSSARMTARRSTRSESVHGFFVKGSAVQYVVGIDVERNIIRVSPRRDAAARKTVSLAAPHWVAGSVPDVEHVSVQARYRERPFIANVAIENDTMRTNVEFAEPHIAAPGQSLVFYDDEICLGGGIIDSYSAGRV